MLRSELTMSDYVAALRAVAEETRLRLLVLCSRGEWTVSDLVRIVGQSQPRISRHLKILCDAGLLDRFRESSWVFYRLALDRTRREVARRLIEPAPLDDAPFRADRAQCEAIRAARQAEAGDYFARVAPAWDEVRALHVDEAEVEGALLQLLGHHDIGDLLDVGTGTGRILDLFADRVGRAVGVDNSREMLGLARARLDAAGRDNCAVRQADMYRLPLADASFDAAIFHQVLHFADDPAAALAEAGRVLRPGGRVAVVDFAPHELEALRAEHSHRRLGFARDEIVRWCAEAGMDCYEVVDLPGAALTVRLWLAAKPVEINVDKGRSRSRLSAENEGAPT